jgi:hypothetical protein
LEEEFNSFGTGEEEEVEVGTQGFKGSLFSGVNIAVSGRK